MSLPKILVIDDQFGRMISDRRNLCINFGLKDVTGDDTTPEKIKDPVADAIFSPAQRIEKGVLINDSSIALSAIKEGWQHKDGWYWAMVLLDIRFVSGRMNKDGVAESQTGDMDFGISILNDIRRDYPDLPVVMLSSRERDEVIEECRNKGALDFIQRIGFSSDARKPKEILSEKLFYHGLLPDTRDIKSESQRIVGSSLPLLLTLRSARRSATGSGNILLLGETGTGKELIARYIHDVSPKSKGHYKIFHPFGTAETLQEDELFGHVKGAFTGATSDREGLFELSNNGTLFIDEIGDIAENLQLKLLRPLENRVTTRQGGKTENPLDIQVVLATNKNLEEFTRTGRFKSDLLNRINAYTIKLSPLRERKEDIPVIAERLVEILCREHNARLPRKILPETMELLINNEWTDNVRGLRNVLERAIKDNKDSELIVPSDIRFDTYTPEIERVETLLKMEEEVTDSIDDLIKRLSTFEFPKDYAKISGKLPALQEAIGRMLANYLLSAIEVTKKMKPGSADGEINLTGAASCMMGTQLKTPKAADLIKKLLQMDGAVLEKLLKESPVLNKVYNEALRLRPKKPIK